jgi:hypothetical protein
MCANSVLMRKKADQGGRGCGERVTHSWTPAEENKNLAVCELEESQVLQGKMWLTRKEKLARTTFHEYS